MIKLLLRNNNNNNSNNSKISNNVSNSSSIANRRRNHSRNMSSNSHQPQFISWRIIWRMGSTVAFILYMMYYFFPIYYNMSPQRSYYSAPPPIPSTTTTTHVTTPISTPIVSTTNAMNGLVVAESVPTATIHKEQQEQEQQQPSRRNDHHNHDDDRNDDKNTNTDYDETTTNSTSSLNGTMVVSSVYEVSNAHCTTANTTATKTTGYDSYKIISTAICYKTLFGTSIDIGLILQWIAYHHLLGFDHFFFFYRDEVMSLPNWDELTSNPFVTMIAWNDIGTRESYYDQAAGTEVQCLTNYAAQYDWVFIADIDEYLYLGPKNRDDLMFNISLSLSSIPINEDEVGYIVTPFSVSSTDVNDILTVKELLYIYNNMTYLSFGKRMYSLDHRIGGDDVIGAKMDDDMIYNYQITTTALAMDDNTTIVRPDTRFIVTYYPYYMTKYFCHHRGHRRGDVICPKWRGRSKVMVRPQYHTFIDVHGNYAPDEMYQRNESRQGIIHFHPDLYHIKEWPHLDSPHNITIHYPPPSDIDNNQENDSTISASNIDSDNVIGNEYIDGYYNFTITNEEEVHIHNMHTGYLPYIVNDDNNIKEETFLVKQDTTLQQYFQNVMNLATNMYGNPIRIQQQQ